MVALVQVMKADPGAIVGFFPCDHYYSDDESFRSTIRSATACAEQFPGSLVIVGARLSTRKLSTAGSNRNSVY
jgi:mannose-1-phosphate guanylyltransferase